MRDLDQPVRNGNARRGTVASEGDGPVTSRDESVPIVPGDRLLDVAAALAQGATRMHTRLSHLEPQDRDDLLELVSDQVSEIVALWIDLVRDVVSTDDHQGTAGARRSAPPAPRPPTPRQAAPRPPAPPPALWGGPDSEAGDNVVEHDRPAESPWRARPDVPRQQWEPPTGPDTAGRAVDRHEIDRLTRDELTGVLNRQAGLEALGREVDRCRRSGERMVLGFLNVDRLKILNESKGPRAGDEVLRKVASALRATLRSYDVVVRLGGDEFLFSLPGADAATAELRFNEFSVLLGEEAPGTTASVGLAELRERDTLDDLISRADATLAKNRRNRRQLP